MDEKKLKCLVVEDESDLNDMIGAYLECTYNVEVLSALNGIDAIEKINQNPDLAMVICDYNMPKANGGKVYFHIKQNSLKVDFIYCSSDPIAMHPEIDQDSVAGVIEKPQILAGIDKFFSKFKNGASNQEMQRTPDEMYVKVRLSMFKKTNVLPCDLFIQLGKSKFVKYMSKNDLFTDEDSLKIYGKKLDYLSINSNDLENFFAKIFREFYSAQAQLEALPPSESEVAALVYIQETIQDLAFNYGFTKELQRITKNQVSAALQVINHNPGLKMYLDDIMKESEHYLAAHSVCLTAVSCNIAERMGWGSDQTFYKLALASLLHDSTLANQDLAKCQTNLDLVRESKRFTEDEKEAWRNHPNEASHLASRFTEIPPDVDSIILQHHERPDGSGFPNRLSSLHISPLSAVFIVAGDLVAEMFRLQEAFSMKDYLRDRNDYFGSGQFRKIMECLDDEALAATG